MSERRQLLLPPPLRAGPDPDRLAIFGDRTPCEIVAFLLEKAGQSLVREDFLWVFRIAQGADARLDRFGRGAFAIGRGDAAGEEIFQFERAARAG